MSANAPAPVTAVDESGRHRPPPAWLRREGWVSVVFWAVVFGVAHTQGPLYYSNQNQYLLHGLALAGRGDLEHDWLANTRDPTPVFSAGVAILDRVFGEWSFHAAYFVLLGVYFHSLLALVDALPFAPRTALANFGFRTLLVAVHAAAVRLLSVHLTGVDYPWFFQCGVANQYVLGPGLQPSAFGVLLITSLAAFARNRTALAVVCLSAAAIVHATYLLPAALLTLAYIAVLGREGRWRSAVRLGAGALAAVAPVVVYSALAFAPTSAEEFAEAQYLLAKLRIPHHADVSRWLDPISWGQIAWAALGVALTWGTRLFLPLALPAAGAVVLSVVQVVTDSNTLALLFPWRLSAVLVPVATAVILARLVSGLAVWGETWTARARLVAWVATAILLAAIAEGGIAVSVGKLGYRMNDTELWVLEYVREHKRPGDVYLIPVSIPQLGDAPRRFPATPSTTFTPPPRPKPGATLIPVDFQRFRLVSGAPIYVDFKSVPYKDTEVLEWYRRLRLAEGWYAANDWGRVRDELIREGVTHVVTTADRAPAGDALEPVYTGDDHYRVYRVRRSPGAD